MKLLSTHLSAGDRRTNHRAFSLIEILVVITLLVVIIFGLLVMFNQTQRAFQTGMTQVDVLEGGRAATEMIARELQEVVPAYRTDGVNFYSSIPVLAGMPASLDQRLPGIPSNGPLRSNTLQELFFLTKVNQYWSGIGYRVRDFYGGVGTLYRFETNMHVFNGDPGDLYRSYINPAVVTADRFSRVLEGVVDFKVRAFNTNGYWITDELLPSFANRPNSDVRMSTMVPGEVGLYLFYNDAVPAFVEFQLGILEQRTLERAKSIPIMPDPTPRRTFLEDQAGNVHVFRMRVPVRNVDASAYR